MIRTARKGKNDTRLIRSALSILTVITGLGLTALILRTGHVAWWFAPIVLVWNLGPLVAMRLLADRRDRWSPALLPMAWGLFYVAVLCWGYYDAFYRAPGPMAGFAYLLLPPLGWLGLAIESIVDSCVAIWSTAKRR
ncbi:hypothetical protein HZY97_17250 [Sphingomonas sp. R-74633]|uniref:hypothetical protein n=1 Tax=Sphingomonas sp. R-74633 TaxID=2751188 RepID=UPI0015D45E1B|nr:hypothetical protein [Sphingomonas sp. R-74633]NYT42522.1 hypothetical protein [Sphingomonas sp. R-74633]